MEIGSIIRSRRAARGFTQAQVAQALGVTATAVSKWERNTSLPEVTLLPALARLLGTDLNDLLAFQQEMTREEVSAFLETLHRTAGEGGLAAAFALAKEQRKQFPRCGLLALNTALTLEGLAALAGAPLEAEDAQWVRALYRQAAESADSAVAAQARAMLFSQALEAGEVDQAEEWLQDLPPQPLYDKSSMQARLALARKDWAKAGEQWEGNLLHQIGQVQSTLLSLMDLAAQEGRREDIAPLADAACTLTHCFGLWPYETWSVRLQQALLTEDVEGGLTALEGLLDTLDRPWVLGPLFRRLGQRETASLTAQLRPAILRELTDPDNPTYDLLRDSPRFRALVEKVEG